MSRETCYRCFWPKALCWCPTLAPIETRTRFVFLMHPKEYKREKAGTGRLTHLCLPNSELHMGLAFDDHEAVRACVNDPRNFPVLLYPGREATNLSWPEPAAGFGARLGQRTLVVFLLDATWSGARKMLKLSPVLQHLPRLMFTPAAPSRYVIKQQPQAGCLSTLEAVHELLAVLERAGLDRYSRPEQLLGVFHRMQDFQIGCAADPARAGYRHRPYSDPGRRVPGSGRSGTRRSKYVRGPVAAPAAAEGAASVAAPMA
jgi:DTW domain-containing protein YfiP